MSRTAQQWQIHVDMTIQLLRSRAADAAAAAAVAQRIGEVSLHQRARGDQDAYRAAIFHLADEEVTFAVIDRWIAEDLPAAMRRQVDSLRGVLSPEYDRDLSEREERLLRRELVAAEALAAEMSDR